MRLQIEKALPIAFKLAWPKTGTTPLEVILWVVGLSHVVHSSGQITISGIGHPEPVVGISPRQPVIFWSTNTCRTGPRPMGTKASRPITPDIKCPIYNWSFEIHWDPFFLVFHSCPFVFIIYALWFPRLPKNFAVKHWNLRAWMKWWVNTLPSHNAHNLDQRQQNRWPNRTEKIGILKFHEQNFKSGVFMGSANGS